MIKFDSKIVRFHVDGASVKLCSCASVTLTLNSVLCVMLPSTCELAIAHQRRLASLPDSYPILQWRPLPYTPSSPSCTHRMTSCMCSRDHSCHWVTLPVPALQSFATLLHMVMLAHGYIIIAVRLTYRPAVAVPALCSSITLLHIQPGMSCADARNRIRI